MRIIGNFLWLLFGGLLYAFTYFIESLFFAITIVGIPIALQIFKSRHI